MKTKITFILLLWLFMIGGVAFAQVQINAPTTYQPVSLSQGGAPGTYKVDIVNNNPAVLNATFSLALPAGMEYVAGTITGANELSIANLQNPTFTLNSIPVGNTLPITFNARINCGYSTSTINYSVISGGSTIATGSSAVAGNTPAPAYVLPTVPSPQVLNTPLNTNAFRTFKFKNSGVLPVTTVYIESAVANAAQASSYKIMSADNGTVSSITNGYRVTLTGTALQNAITTAVGAADTSFDPGEEITVVLTEQMLSCSAGSSIALNMKAGSGDIKGSLCFFDGSTASITTTVGNPSISITRLTGTTWPTFCENGKVSYTVKNEGTGVASNIFDIKFPWSVNYTNASLPPNVEPAATLQINKIFINGTDVTSLVLKRNGNGVLIPGLQNCFVIDLAGLTSAYGTSLQSLNGDGKFDDLEAGQSFQLDFEYGFSISTFKTCSLTSYPTFPTTGNDYFALGTSYADKCGTRINRTNYNAGSLSDYTKTSFQVASQQYNTFSANLSAVALQSGDKIKLNVGYGGVLSGAFTQTGAKIIKTFTFILPDGLDYDASGVTRLMWNATGTVIPTSAISYNAATKTLSITPLASLSGLNATNDNFEIPLIVSGSGSIVNKTIQYSATLGFTGCDVTMPYGCSSMTLNYAIVDTSCATVGTTSFDITRATFGYVPAPTNTNIWYTPTAFVNENTAGINLHGAVSKDKVKTTFTGIVNSTSFTELWARVKYTSNSSNITQSNFDKLSAVETDVAGTITVTKALDGSTLSTNITVADILFSYDSGTTRQLQQVNLSAKIGAGKAIDYTLQVGDKIAVNWFTRVTRNNLSYMFSPLQNLEGDLYTKDSGGTASNCQPIPVNFSIQRLNLLANSFSGVQAVVGLNSMRINASLLNGNHSTDVAGDHFPNEVRNYAYFRNVTMTIPGIWIMDQNVGKEPYISASSQVGGVYKVNPNMFTISYSGGNTIVTANNVALGSNGLPLSTANIPTVSDWIGANGNQNLSIFMLPVCATPGPVPVATVQNYDLYTTEADNSTTESYMPNTFTQGAATVTYYSYSANATPTLQNVDGIGSTVTWQVKVTNTSDTAAIVAAGGDANLPNNWISFVSPNNNITVTKVTDIATGTEYPVLNYGAGKYWVKLGSIATNATFDVKANYTACTDDKLQTTYSFGAIGYPDNPDTGVGSGISTCAANETKFDLNLYPKDVALSMTVTSPANPVQFCTNTTAGENLIDYTAQIANTAAGNAENLIFEAVFPDGYVARAGTSKITYNGTTKTLSNPVYNSTRGTWQWNISTDPNGIPFLPGAASGANSFVFEYQGETSCGFVSGTAVSYNMMVTSGCGKAIEYQAAGTAMELSMKPSAINTYYLATDVVALKNDGSGTPYQIEVTNQGSLPLQAGESIFVTIPNSLDYVPGSVVHIAGAANVGEPVTATLGNTRILKFPLPTGADNVNLNQNETARFSIQLKIVNPKLLNCGVTPDTIKLEAIYAVAGVTCGAVPCDVSVITGTVKSNIDVTKTSFTINPVSGLATYASSTNNNVTVKYTVTNTGTIANSTPIVVDFFNDLNKDGLYTTNEPILYTQTITGGAESLAAGAVSAEQTTATFTVPESAICNITAVMRLANNSQICADTAVLTPVEFESATTAFSVCAGSNVTIGNPPNGATVSWSPATYLSDAAVSNPVFNYNGTTLAVPTDFIYTATVTHVGGCTSTYTNTVTVNPLPIATIAYPNASYCNRGTAAVTLTGVTGGTFTGDTGLVINSTTGEIDLAASTIGNHDVTYSYTNGTCQNTTNTVIRINATTLPGTLSNITGQCSVTPAAPTLTDPCAGTITATTATPFPITVQGTTTLTWTFDYGNGFTRTATQDVVIKDITAPVVPILTDVTGECSVTPTAPTTTDNCAGTVTGTTTTVFPITTQGITLVTWTFADGNGNTSEATQNVNIQDVTAPDTPTLDPIIAKCPVTLTAPTTTDNCAGTVTGTTTTTFPITAKGNTNVTWTFDDGNNNTTTAVQVVTILDITADISGGTAVCENAPSPKVTFTGAGGTAPYTFTYTINGGADQTVTTTAGNSVDVDVPTDTAGTFTYSLVSVRDADAACENLQIGTATFTINPLPTATISGTTAVCNIADNPIITFTGSGGTAPYTFTYKVNGDADQTVSTTVGNEATVEVPTDTVGSFVYTLVSVKDSSSACTQAQTGTAIVTVNPLPAASISGTATVCQNASSPIITFTGSGGTAPYTFIYNIDGGANQTITTTSGDSVEIEASTATVGTFYYNLVSVKDGSSTTCEATRTGYAIITVNALPTVQITNPAAVCSGTAVDLTAPAVTAGSTAGLTYAYFTDAAGTTALASPNAVTAGGTYYIQGTTADGCKSAIQSVVVTVNPAPTVVIVDPAAVCSGTTVDLTAAGVTAGSTEGLTYAYFTDAAGTTALASPNAVTASGTYYIQGTTAEGCKSAIEPVIVTIDSTPTLIITNPAAVCSGTTVDLTAPAVTAGSSAGLTYAYYTDAAGTVALANPNAVTAGGTYYIQGTALGGCKSAIQSVTVTVNPTPTVQITNPAAVCSGTAVDLTAPAVTAGSTAGVTYAYFTDAAGTTALASPNAVTAGGTYYIQGTTADGCKSAIEPVTVTVNPIPILVINNPDAICSGTSADLTAAAVTAGSTEELTYAYFTDAAGTTVLDSPDAIREAGTYYIKGITAAGCSSEIKAVTVTVNALLSLSGTESTLCAVDGTGYVLSFSVTGQAPYTVTGTGAPGTWNGNDWTSDKILAGTDYNVSVQDAYACNAVTVVGIAPICCVYEVKVPTFSETTVTCYSEIPTATTLTKAEYEALGNGDGTIGSIPCGVIEITASNSSDPGCNGNVTRTYTVTEYADPNNNKVRDAGEDIVLNSTSVAQNFAIVRADFLMPANGASTVQCSSEVVMPVVPQVKDNCGNVLTAPAPVISPMPACNGTVTYTYTFTDCAGHTHDWVYTYTINNTVAPKGTAPANITVQCIGDIPVANASAVINVTGNCNNSVTVTVADTNNGGSGCSSNPYIVTRTYTLTDCGGLTTQLVQTITAVDTTVPIFVEALPLDMTLECTDAIPAAPTLTAIDNCSTVAVTFNEVKVNGSCSGNYQLQRTWTAVDACGNNALHKQTINVVDTKAPVFVEALPEKEVYANCTTIPEVVTLTATDDCSNAVVTFNESRIDGSCSGRYKLIRTWTAEDDCGNQNTVTQMVDVSCLEVFNGLSPNGDGINDTLEIGGIDCFPNNSVKIYNRYGVLVYEKNGYDNVTNPFAGFSDGRATVLKGDKLPTGTYFYTFEYDDNGKQVQKSGYIYISNN